MHFYREEFDHPDDVGGLLEKALLKPTPVAT
jgi:hypothetical protein